MDQIESLAATTFASCMIGALITVVLAASMIGCAELPARRALPGAEPHTVVQPVARPRVALVLSGGSLRGFAHLGVLKVLAANDIRPDLIVGTSAGSIVGGLYASGLSVEALEAAAATVDFDLFSGFVASRFGMGRPLVHGFVDRYTQGARIESFPIRFAAVATDLQSGCLAVFNGGDAAIAMQASTAVPGVFAPTSIGGRDYVDGSLVSPLPVRVARALGAERVIAVDVVFDPNESRLSSTIDRLFQTALVMTRTLANQEAREADVLVAPTLPSQEEVTLDNRQALIAAGEKATLAALPRIKALIESERIGPTHVAARPGGSHWCSAVRPLQTASTR